MKSREARKVRGRRGGAAAHARRRRRVRVSGGGGACACAAAACALYAPVLRHLEFFIKKKLESAKMTRGQRRVYDSRHFRAGAKPAHLM